MTGITFKFILFEFRKIWTLPVIIISAIILFFSLLITFLPFIFGVYSAEGPIQELNVSLILSSAFSVLVPLMSFMFGAGIISNDIKSHWLRTVLSRPVTRADYLLTKIITASTAIFIILIICGSVPVIILSFLTPNKVEFDFIRFISIHALYLGEALTYISILALLSCWAPGFMNVFILAIWMLVDMISSSVINSYFWDNSLALIISDFFFPSGFKEAAAAIISNGDFPIEKILWGFSSLFGFLSLALLGFSFIQIDKGIE
jgi:ABC-type transport system involved in multi-copper enzyme maturation permease subunit